ncbi:MAG: hypothetical protein NTX42_01990 [Methanothrix sp.]|nr:hypothetical protein [Methanothrix sp.]
MPIPFYFINGRVDIRHAGSRDGQVSTGEDAANGLKFNSGRCGKAGQLVPVSDGSPHLLVAEATVGGAG